MNYFQYKISHWISKESPEYKSISDFKKLDNLYTLTRLNRELNSKEIIFHPNARIFNIPIIKLKIYHQNQAVVGSDGSILIEKKHFQKASNSSSIEKLFNYVENLNLKTIKNLSDLKAFIKKMYFSFFSFRAYRNRKILKDQSITKIIFFETAYDNMYHFLFQYYPSLLELIDHCKKLNLDYYIVMPPKCNRGLRFRHFYRNIIQNLIEIEGFNMHKIIFLDYQNYNVCNLYHTNFPSENPEIQFKAINKLKKYFLLDFIQKNNTVGGGG